MNYSISSTAMQTGSIVEPQNDHLQAKYHLNYTTNLMEKLPTQATYLSGQNQYALETSFEEKLFEQHSRAIWNGSIQFLKSSLKRQFDEKKGFNDKNIIDEDMEAQDLISEDEDILQIIDKNSILSYDEKKKFKGIAQKKTHLKNLLTELYNMFTSYIFQELVMIIYQCTAHYIKYKQSLKIGDQLTKFLSPAFTNITSDNLQNVIKIDYYAEQKESEIINMADQAGGEVAGIYFINRKIQFLNLKSIDVPKANSNLIRAEFENFVSIIAKGIFLCLEGCFNHPDEAEQMFGGSQSLSFTDKSINEDELCEGKVRKRKNC